MRAVKANKVIQIDKAELKTFKARGFDIYEGDKLVVFGDGKTVPYAKYHEVVQELEKVKAELEALKPEETEKEEPAKATKTAKKE